MFNLRVNVYDSCKHELDPEVCEELRIENVRSLEIVSDADGADEVEKIEAAIDGEHAKQLIDQYHEYVIVHMEDGNTLIFRNSYVDVFTEPKENSIIVEGRWIKRGGVLMYVNER